MSTSTDKNLAEALIQDGLVKREVLPQAFKKASQNKTSPMVVALFDLGLLTFKAFEKFILSRYKIKSAIISAHDITPELISRVGMRIIETHLVLPISLREQKGSRFLALGMVDPTDSEIISRIEENFGCRVVPILISLPDFKNALERNKTHLPDQTQISINNKSTGISLEENAVPSIRFGATSSGISLSSAKATKFSGSINKTATKTEAYTVIQRPEPAMEFMGSTSKKFKEEILAKLDLNPKEALLLTEENYSREELAEPLQKLGRNRLQKIYDEASPEARIEALQNILLAKGLITKHDILFSTALSAAFDGEK